MPLSDSLKQFFKAKSLEFPAASAPRDIAVGLAEGTLTSARVREIVEAYGVTGDRLLRATFLDWVLGYVALSLAAQPMAAQVADAVRPLKQILGIKEGDFLELRPAEVKALLLEQLENILEDGVLDDHEELAQSALQRAFDLGYDQYLALTRPRYEAALHDIRAELERVPAEDLARLERQVLSLRAVCELAVTQPRSLGGLR